MGNRRLFELSVYQVLMYYKNQSSSLERLLRGHAARQFEERLFAFTVHSTLLDDKATLTLSADDMDRIYDASGMTAIIIRWVSSGCTAPIEDVLDFIMLRTEERSCRQGA